MYMYIHVHVCHYTQMHTCTCISMHANAACTVSIFEKAVIKTVPLTTHVNGWSHAFSTAKPAQYNLKVYLFLKSYSLESVEEQDNGAGQSEDEGRAEEKGSSDAEGADLPKLCGWVPSQCCLIPLPESPVAGDGEREEGEREEKGCELSESELQRQHERELEVLFGYKPPPTGSKDPSSTEQPGEDWSAEREGDVSVDKEQALVAAHSGKRSNSTDSGVASISPHSSEGDLEQRPSQHRTDTATRQPNEGEQAGDGCVDSTRGKMKSGVEMNSNPKRPSEQLHLPVSRLKTPSEKLRKCSVFTGSVSPMCACMCACTCTIHLWLTNVCLYMYI